MLSLAGSLVDLVSKSVDKIFPNADSIQKAELKAFYASLNAQLTSVKSELQGNRLQRSWRPALMWLFILILFNNYLFAPYARTVGMPIPTLEFPEWFQSLLMVGVGGYTGGRSLEKCLQIFKGK